MSNKTCPAPNCIELSNTPTDFEFGLMNKQSTELIKKLMFDFNGYIAGGFAIHYMCLSLKQKAIPFGDLDFYFPTAEDYKNAIEYVKDLTGYTDESLETRPYMGESIRASTFHYDGNTYQLIKARFGTVEETFDSFDFTNSKVAIRPNQNKDLYPEMLELVFDERVPSLIKNLQLQYRRQTALILDTLKEKQTHAKSNLDRLEKYQQRFPKGLADTESREHILQQYAWNLKFYPRAPITLPALTQLLIGAAQDELILFFPLGGEWKKAFETTGKSLAPRTQAQAQFGMAFDLSKAEFDKPF